MRAIAAHVVIELVYLSRRRSGRGLTSINNGIHPGSRLAGLSSCSRQCQYPRDPVAMKPMPSRRSTRFTAVVMLFVWLLTMGAGIANACQLHQDHVMGGRIGVGSAGDKRPAGVGADAPLAAQSAHAALATIRVAGDGDQWAHTITCRALCVAGQTAPPKQKAAGCADQHADVVLVATCGPVNALADPTPGRMRFADAPRPEPPVFIRFLRLNL